MNEKESFLEQLYALNRNYEEDPEQEFFLEGYPLNEYLTTGNLVSILRKLPKDTPVSFCGSSGYLFIQDDGSLLIDTESSVYEL